MTSAPTTVFSAAWEQRVVLLLRGATLFLRDPTIYGWCHSRHPAGLLAGRELLSEAASHTKRGRRLLASPSVAPPETGGMSLLERGRPFCRPILQGLFAKKCGSLGDCSLLFWPLRAALHTLTERGEAAIFWWVLW